jgi:hypothetical protein
MINRYAGEIHINPIRVLRNDDFNNDGQIKDIETTLKEAIELNQEIAVRLKLLKAWLSKKNFPSSIQFKFAEGGYISLKGLPDQQLQELAAQGMIELFDFAKDKDWVKKYGQQFGLIWENGRSVEI